MVGHPGRRSGVRHHLEGNEDQCRDPPPVSDIIISVLFWLDFREASTTTDDGFELNILYQLSGLLEDIFSLSSRISTSMIWTFHSMQSVRLHDRRAGRRRYGIPHNWRLNLTRRTVSASSPLTASSIDHHYLYLPQTIPRLANHSILVCSLGASGGDIEPSPPSGG